jgi:regulator of sirC expression with transglutaminase-like and TPR domain
MDSLVARFLALAGQFFQGVIQLLPHDPAEVLAKGLLWLQFKGHV